MKRFARKAWDSTNHRRGKNRPYPSWMLPSESFKESFKP